MLVEMLTEVEGETKDEWINWQATIVQVKEGRYLVHSNVRLSEESTRRFLLTHVRRAARPFGYSTPRHGGLPCDDNSTVRQVGPIIDRGVLESDIYAPHVHKIWMCYLIYAHLLLNAQHLLKTLLPMFLAKLADLALCEAHSAAAGGRFSASVVGLYEYVGMNLGVQLVRELSTMHMSYVDLRTLALTLLKQQLTLQKSMAEQCLVWEMLHMLNKAQNKEQGQDVTHSLREMRDKVLADFSRRPASGWAIYKDTACKVANQVAVCTT